MPNIMLFFALCSNAKQTFSDLSGIWGYTVVNTPGGGCSHQFRIGVCCQGSQTLTLFKGKIEN